MNFLTDEEAQAINAQNPLDVRDSGIATDTVAVAGEAVTFITGAAGFARTVQLAKAPVMNKTGSAVGSYWQTSKNLVDGTTDERYAIGNRPTVLSLVETAASAAVVIHNSKFNMEMVFETPSGVKDYVIVMTDGLGGSLYAWVAGIAKSGDDYTFTLANTPSGSTSSWIGALADFTGTSTGMGYRIFQYDTSLTFVTGTVLTREIGYSNNRSDAEQLRLMSLGDYAVDYRRGRILYKKATNGTSDTVGYSSRGSNASTVMGSTATTSAVRTAAILTNGYVAGTAIDVSGKNQLTLFIDFTLGSLTNAILKIEFSPDGTNYFQETFDSISVGVDTESAATHLFGATGTYVLNIPVLAKTVRVSSIGTGTVTSSSLTISALVGNV